MKKLAHYIEHEYFACATLFIGAIIMCFIAGCSGPKKTQEQKQFEARAAELSQLQQLRDKYPCDTSTRVLLRIDTIAGESITDTVINKDTIRITKYNTIIQRRDSLIKVIDMAALQSARDSVEQAGYLYQQCAEQYGQLDKENAILKDKNESLSKFKTKVLVILFSGIGLGIGVTVLKNFIKI